MADGTETTVKQLQEQAKALEVEGYSSMNKEELEAAIKEASKKPSTPKFSRERLIAEAQAVVGYPSHVVAGALADHPGDGEVTVDAAKKAVDKFLNREVKQEA